MVDKITTPPTAQAQIDKINEIIDAKQDVITDLTTIRSGASAGATALQPNDVDQTYSATSTNAQSGVAINGANFIVNNAAESTNGVAIKGSGSVQSTQIGALGSASSMSTSVGFSAYATGSQSITIGHGAQASASKSYAFGEQAKSTAIGAFQFGQATNNEAGSVYFGLTTDGNTTTNYKLLGSDGKIPDDRLNTTIARTANIPDISNLANKDLSNLSATGEAKFQAPLVSGTNIKTINGNSLLGSGDITIQGGTSYTASCPAITPVDGVATWTVTHNLGSQAVVTALYSNNNKIEHNTLITSNNALTVTFKASSTVSAGSYKIVVLASGGSSSGGSGADVDLSNISDMAKITIVHNAMPSGTYEDLTVGASDTEYIAPADGWFMVHLTTYASAYVNLYITDGTTNEFKYAVTCHGTSTNYNQGDIAPVKKGDILRLNYYNEMTFMQFRFIYAVGSESEAS